MNIPRFIESIGDVEFVPSPVFFAAKACEVKSFIPFNVTDVSSISLTVTL